VNSPGHPCLLYLRRQGGSFRAIAANQEMAGSKRPEYPSGCL